MGCASEKAATKKQDVFEKWTTKAETSKGYSPVPLPKERVVSIQETVAEKEAMAAKPLPTNKVNLKMRNADVKAVVRALARGAGLNILVKNDLKGDISVDFDNVPWNQAFTGLLKSNGLTYLWEGDVIRVMSVDDMEQDVKITIAQEKQVSQTQLTAVVSIDYADPKGLKDNLQEFLKDKEGKSRGSVRVDEHSSSLIIQATKADLNRILPIIEKIDKPTPQILIKANIVETTKEMARDLGIQWGGMYQTKLGGSSQSSQSFFLTPGGYNALTPPVSPVSPAPMTGGYTPLYPPSGGQAGIFGQGYAVDFPVSANAMTAAGGLASLGLAFGRVGGNILDLQLNALQKDGKVNILSSPSITTADNQMAFTENGEKVPFVTNQVSGGTVTQTVNFEDAMLRLEITPHVIDGKNLRMKIIVKKDEVDTTRTVQGNPFIIKKQTQTTLVVQDGETIVISGLTKQRVSDSNSGTPGLKDVPLLGWLFKSESKGDKMEEVLIFITPNILPTKVAAAGPAQMK
jgi:type IV pilus assembly protein PilQ